MSKHDYFFIDESGDPGFAIDPESGELLITPYYTSAVLHITDDAFRDINRHVAYFRFYTGLNKELKIPFNERGFSTLVEPIGTMVEKGEGVYASAVYLDKQLYTGRYLKPSEQMPSNPIWFRNFVLRCLLEHHFRRYPLRSNQYDLVLDRVDTNKDEKENLVQYIERNRNIPTPSHITHASSIYVEALQIVHHIANGYKDTALSGNIPSELKFVNSRDITVTQLK